MAMSRALGGRSVTSRLSMVIEPSPTASKPATQRRSVDLPQPEGPTRTRNSPSRMARLMSCSTRTGPKDFCRLAISIAAILLPPALLIPQAPRRGQWAWLPRVSGPGLILRQAQDEAFKRALMVSLSKHEGVPRYLKEPTGW